MEKWLLRCPIRQFKEQLIKEKTMDGNMDQIIDTEAKDTIEAAVQFAKESPFPSAEEAIQDLFY
jgi:pyruvate dehydrogenase E1 component alpha subunit